MKTLVVLGKGPGPDIDRLVAAGELPRQDYLEIARLLDADVGSFAEASAARGAWFSKLFAKKPITGSVISAFLRRRNYDRMFTTGEDVGLLLALLLRVFLWRGALTMVFHKCTSPRRKKIFKLVGHKAFAHLICVSEAQKRVLVDELGFPPEKITAVLNMIDDRFFDNARFAPAADRKDYVFACGLENRNYPLLCQAAATLPHVFRIAASGFMSLSGFQDSGRPDVPPNVVLEGRLSFDELRQTYANARFIVVPVNDVPYAAGVTGLVEAMSMGKAIVVTGSVGITEYYVPGISALVVPTGNPVALAEAIATLWNDPKRCEEMGAYNRAWIERAMRIDLYCAQVAGIVRGTGK